ncbi:MAG: hypothetical protein D6693_06570 [Planctomycetota bacterium]|nr:MAG: hypothetical protein D6693_06570 [Planctomycetota bacterium]
MMQQAAAPIAVEFGVASLKALQLEPGEEAPSLVAAACLETPEELRGDHEGRLSFQCERLGSLLKGAGFKGRRVIFSIPAPFTLVQHLQLVKSEGMNLTAQIAERLRETLHCDPARVVIRHIEVGDLLRGGGSRTEVICFAVARDMVLRIMAGARAAKCEVIGAHSEHVATARAFDRVTRRASDENLTSLFLDVGAGASKVVMTRGRRVVFAKTIHVSGRDLDQAVAAHFACEPAEARARRLAMGAEMPKPVTARIPAAADAPANTPDRTGGVATAPDRRVGAVAPGLTAPVGAGADELAEPLRDTLDAMAAEVSMCVRYYERHFGDAPVGRCVFVGGEARDASLCRRLAERLRLPAQIGDPMSCVKRSGKEPTRGVDFSAPQPGWAAPFGLCFAPRNL